MSWTRLQGTKIWEEAKAQYERDPRRLYHGWSHIERRYEHAEKTFSFAYDLDLDLAILTHDVIYDANPLKELRSAEWLAAHWDAPCPVAYDLVMTTAGHEICTDNRMILIDLADFMDQGQTILDRDALRAELKALHGIDDRTFAHANAAFYEAMQARYSEALISQLSDLEAGYFREIRTGIRRSICLAREEMVRA